MWGRVAQGAWSPVACRCKINALAFNNHAFICQVTDLLNVAEDPTLLPPHSLAPNTVTLKEISVMVDQRLQSAWDWLEVVMDCTEAQLRFGLSLSAVTDPSHPSHPLHEVPSKVNKVCRNREDPSLLRALDNKRKRCAVRR